MGHPRVEHILRRATARPTGTYLFVGSPGVGKRNAARVFAAALVCPQACGRCNTCQRVLAGLHPDVTILQPEGYTFPVEVLRATALAASQTPIEAAHRVFIIQEADRIPERSQNALLKALEEPHRSVVWVLLAHAVQPFLPTILSRCQIVDFPAIAEDQLLGLLQDRFGLQAGEAAGMARIARGDLNAAVGLAENPRVSAVRRLALRLAAAPGMEVAAALDAADQAKALAAQARADLEKSQAAEMARLEETGGSQGQAAWRKRMTDRNKRALRRVETEVSVDLLGWMGAAFRDLAAISAGATEEALVAQDHAQALSQAASLRPTRFWLDMVEHCLQGQIDLGNNANAPLVVESILLRLV